VKTARERAWSAKSLRRLLVERSSDAGDFALSFDILIGALEGSLEALASIRGVYGASICWRQESCTNKHVRPYISWYIFHYLANRTISEQVMELQWTNAQPRRCLALI